MMQAYQPVGTVPATAASAVGMEEAGQANLEYCYRADGTRVLRYRTSSFSSAAGPDFSCCSCRHLYSLLGVPATILALVVFVVGLAALETDATKGQRIFFAILASATLLLGLAYAIFTMVRFWSGLGERSLSASLWPLVDTFLTLCIGWTMVAFSFYLFNQTGFYDTSTHSPSSNRWLAAIDFLASTVAGIVTAPQHFPPIHPATRAFTMASDLFHYLYTLLMLGAGAAAVYEAMKERRAERRRLATEAPVSEGVPMSSMGQQSAVAPATIPVMNRMTQQQQQQQQQQQPQSSAQPKLVW